MALFARFVNDIFPIIGAKPIGTVTAPELLEALRRIEARGAVETAHRTLQNCGQVFRYAIATGRAERGPAADLRGALTSIKHTRFASITEPKEIGALLRDIDAYQGTSLSVRPAYGSHMYSCAPASCAARSGKNSIWRPRNRNGAYQLQE